jgi:hypothetical protein
MKNWIAIPNPFSLPAPPEWWLQALADLHPKIVIFAGMTEKVYRVGERVQATKLLKTSDPSGESARMLRHGCVPLCSLVAWVQWNQDFFEWLDAHDTWALKGTPEGSGDAAANRLEEIDRLAQARLDREQADAADQVGSSAHFGLLARKGELVFLSGDHRRSEDSGQPTVPPDGGPRD